MARFNTIWAGPDSENMPQKVEAQAAASLTPGLACTITSGKLALAAAATTTEIYIVQDNYLIMDGVDDAIAANDTAMGLVILPEMFYNVRIATGINVAKGAALAVGAGGTIVLSTAGSRVIGFADEAYNNTSGSAQLVRMRGATSFRQIA